MSKDRNNNDPIVIGGGPCAYNPEPIADFFDMFYIGEGEVSYNELIDLFKECKSKGFNRKEFLLKASKIKGIYVPVLYEVTYNDDKTIKSFAPINSDVPAKITKCAVEEISET